MFRGKNLAAVGALLLVAALAVVTGASAKHQAAPIVIEVIAPVATPIENYPDAQAGVEAAAAAINKAGGIKGQQIEVKFCNTNSNANTASACARQAVSDGAAFVTGYLGTQSPLIIPILAQANSRSSVPARQVTHRLDEPVEFPIAGGAASNYQAIPFAVKKLGKKRFFVFYQDVPSAATNAKNVLRAAKIAKLPIVGSAVLPGATTTSRRTCRSSVMPPGRGHVHQQPRRLGRHDAGGRGARREAAVEPQRRLHRRARGSQIGAPTEGMLIASDLPSFRDVQYKGIRHFLSDMKAAGKADNPVNLKVTGIATWTAVYAVKNISPNVKGAVTNTSLLTALRAQTKPINVEGFLNWRPGVKGPAALPRWNTMMNYWMTFRSGKAVSWARRSPRSTWSGRSSSSARKRLPGRPRARPAASPLALRGRRLCLPTVWLKRHRPAYRLGR